MMVKASEIVRIPIDAIVRRPDCRHPDHATIESLADSIEAIGLLSPVRVRRAGDVYELIAGSHRYAAVDSLGWAEIPAVIADDDDLHAELAMIDENLCRAELSPSDRARQTARRKAIYEELHPQARHGGDRKSDQVAKLATRSFNAETAAATGQSERVVRRDVERGEKVLPEVHGLIRGTRLDTGTYLDKLKKLPGNEQFATAERDLTIDRQRHHAKPAAAMSAVKQPQAAASLPPDQAFTSFVDLADRMETLRIADIIRASGRQRSVLGQRASGIADMMNDIMEGLNQ